MSTRIIRFWGISKISIISKLEAKDYKLCLHTESYLKIRSTYHKIRILIEFFSCKVTFCLNVEDCHSFVALFITVQKRSNNNFKVSSTLFDIIIFESVQP